MIHRMEKKVCFHIEPTASVKAQGWECIWKTPETKKIHMAKL